MVFLSRISMRIPTTYHSRQVTTASIVCVPEKKEFTQASKKIYIVRNILFFSCQFRAPSARSSW